VGTSLVKPGVLAALRGLGGGADALAGASGREGDGEGEQDETESVVEWLEGNMDLSKSDKSLLRLFNHDNLVLSQICQHCKLHNSGKNTRKGTGSVQVCRGL